MDSPSPIQKKPTNLSKLQLARLPNPRIVLPKTRGILSTMCTSPLLDINKLKYDYDTFTKT
jgi:hypothetical protein